MKKLFFLLTFVLITSLVYGQNQKDLEKYLQYYFKAIQSADWNTLKTLQPDDYIIGLHAGLDFEESLHKNVPLVFRDSVKAMVLSGTRSFYFINFMESYFSKNEFYNGPEFWHQIEVVEIANSHNHNKHNWRFNNTIETYDAYALLFNQAEKQHYFVKIENLFYHNNRWQGGNIDVVEKVDKNAFQQQVNDYLNSKESAIEESVTTEVAVAADTVPPIYIQSTQSLYQGVINNESYEFSILFYKTDDENPAYYLENVTYSNNSKKSNQDKIATEIIRDYSPLCIIKSIKNNTFYYIKFINQDKLEVAIFDELGKGSGFSTFMRQK